MRNLILLLLLANVLYFLWERFVAEPETTGVVVVDENDLGPKLELADGTVAEPEDSNEPTDPEDPTADIFAEEDGETETMAATRATQLEAVVGRSCVSIGPFSEQEEASGALAEFEDDDLRGTVRATPGQVFLGHWVQIRNIPNRARANGMLAVLQEGGLNEAYIVQTEDEGIKISLGLFGDVSGAERIELQAKSMDLPADISPRMRDQEVYYVDLGLPPGRGAGNIVERYGEERVQLRDAATCPNSG